MYEAYLGTIDYEGETIVEALKEVESYFARADSVAMLSQSTIAVMGDEIISACLLSKWETREEPLITYLMTNTKYKNKGLATALTRSTLKKIHDGGFAGVRAVVTEGNAPSERVMKALGFSKVT